MKCWLHKASVILSTFVLYSEHRLLTYVPTHPLKKKLSAPCTFSGTISAAHGHFIIPENQSMKIGHILGRPHPPWADIWKHLLLICIRAHLQFKTNLISIKFHIMLIFSWWFWYFLVCWLYNLVLLFNKTVHLNTTVQFKCIIFDSVYLHTNMHPWTHELTQALSASVVYSVLAAVNAAVVHSAHQ